MKRYLFNQITDDLEEKMVFLTGPRQCGKTTLAQQLPSAKYGYMNWDIDEDRERILGKDFPNSDLWIFDEIHKFKRWRNFLKGLYDQNKRQKILVTGSARLDLYRRGGDSLQGRYHLLRLHPLTFKEVKGSSQADLLQLFHLGGFPEPFLKGSQEKAQRWSKQYRTRVIRDEIPALENVKDIDLLDLLARALPDKVGSPLSINSLREDLQVSFKSVQRWIEIFEKLYIIFRLTPFGSPLLKSVKKEQKHYHYDWNLLLDEGARFENFIACHLLKWVHFEVDSKGRDLEFKYFRDEESREVDFVITENRKPILFVEAKLSEKYASPSLTYIKRKFSQVRAVQVCLHTRESSRTADGVELISAQEFLKELI